MEWGYHVLVLTGWSRGGVGWGILSWSWLMARVGWGFGRAGWGGVGWGYPVLVLAGVPPPFSLWVDIQSENITFPRTSYAGCNYIGTIHVSNKLKLTFYTQTTERTTVPEQVLWLWYLPQTKYLDSTKLKLRRQIIFVEFSGILGFCKILGCLIMVFSITMKNHISLFCAFF